MTQFFWIIEEILNGLNVYTFEFRKPIFSNPLKNLFDHSQKKGFIRF